MDPGSPALRFGVRDDAIELRMPVVIHPSSRQRNVSI